MSSYRPQYGDFNQQAANSAYRSSQASQRRGNLQQPPVHQGEYYEDYDQENGVDIYAIVDSWRSYRNDTTNLQQIAGYAGSQSYDYVPSFQQPLGANPYGFNPAAPVFHPAYMPPQTNSVQSFFTTYQPLRVSGGPHGMNGQQTRFSSSVANSGNGGRYNFRSRAPVDYNADMHDLLVPSIESPSPWNLPINTRSDPQRNTFRRITPQRSTRSVTPLPVPSATQEYLDHAASPPTNLFSPQKLLVVLDLNGTLLKRAASRGTKFVLRPGVTTFIDYLFANHAVMVYSSARPDNVTGMVAKLLHPKQRSQLAAIWARDKLGLTFAQYKSKIQVYKRLETIWADVQIQRCAGPGRKWDQSNTVLIDDTYLKARTQPHNLLLVEEFTNDRPAPERFRNKAHEKEYMEQVNTWNNEQQKIIMELQEKLEALKWTADVSQLIRSWQVEEEKVKKSDGGSNKKRTFADMESQPEQIQLLTPKSPEYEPDDGSSDSEESGGEVDVDRKWGDGSISPVDESVWKEILDGDKGDVSRTSKSLDG